MSLRPRLDQHDAKEWSPEVEEHRAVNAAECFLQEYPGYVQSPNNDKLLIDWLASNDVPISRRNLGVAFEELSALDAFEKSCVESEPEVDKGSGITKLGVKDTVVLTYKAPDTPTNRALVAHEFAHRQSLCPIGQEPKKTTLGELHRKSVLAERGARNAEGLPARWQEAVQIVSADFPDLNRNSAKFNALVAKVISN